VLNRALKSGGMVRKKEIMRCFEKLLQKDLAVCNICSIFADNLQNVAGITYKPK
jgi:hypothetical protein